MLRKKLVQIDVLPFAVNVIVNLSINSIIGRQRKVAPLASAIGLFMYDICHLWLADDVLIEVEVDQNNGETFFTLFEQENGFASPSN